MPGAARAPAALAAQTKVPLMHHIGPIAGVAAQGGPVTTASPVTTAGPVTRAGYVATAGYDNRLILWDAAERRAIARANHDHLANACAFSHDGTRLVSASSDGTARIWSVPDLRLLAVMAGHGDDVDMARFSPDDALIATCALDRVVRVFTSAGVPLQAMVGHTGNVLALAWIDARRFVTSSVDGTLRTWCALTGECLAVADLGMRSDCVAMAADGRILAGDDAGRIAVIAPGAPPQFVPGHDAGVKTLVLAADGRSLVSLGYDRTLVVWDLAPGALPVETARTELPAEIWARTAAVCGDGRIATGTFGGTYALFDPATGQWDMAGAVAGEAINALAIDAELRLTIGDAGTLRIDGEASGGPGHLCNFLAVAEGHPLTGGHLGQLCDAISGQVFYRHPAPLNCAATFARGGVPHLAVGTYTGEVLVFAVAGPIPVLVRTLAVHAHAVKSLAIGRLMAGEDLLMSVCADGTIAWHRIADLSETRRIERAHTRIGNAACALGAAGFASVGRDRMLRLWLPGREVAVETPHPASVKCVAASPCGRWIASGSYAGTIVLFDRAAMAFAPLQRRGKAGISALGWDTRAGGFLAADYAGAVHDIALPRAERQRAAA